MANEYGRQLLQQMQQQQLRRQQQRAEYLGVPLEAPIITRLASKAAPPPLQAESKDGTSKTTANSSGGSEALSQFTTKASASPDSALQQVPDATRLLNSLIGLAPLLQQKSTTPATSLALDSTWMQQQQALQQQQIQQLQFQQSLFGNTLSSFIQQQQQSQLQQQQQQQPVQQQSYPSAQQSLISRPQKQVLSSQLLQQVGPPSEIENEFPFQPPRRSLSRSTLQPESDFFGATLGKAENKKQHAMQQREYRDALLEQMQQREAAKQQRQQQQKLEEMEYRRKLELEIEAEKRQREEEEARRQERARQLKLQQEAAAAAIQEQQQLAKARRYIDIDAERARAGLPKIRSQPSNENQPQPQLPEAPSSLSVPSPSVLQHELQQDPRKMRYIWEAEHPPQLKAQSQQTAGTQPTLVDPRFESLQAELRRHAEEVRFLQQQQQQIFHQHQQQLLQRLQQEELLRFMQTLQDKQGPAPMAGPPVSPPSAPAPQSVQPLLESLLPKLIGLCLSADYGSHFRHAAGGRTGSSPSTLDEESLTQKRQLVTLLRQAGLENPEAFLQFLQLCCQAGSAQCSTSKASHGCSPSRHRASKRDSESSSEDSTRPRRWGPRVGRSRHDCPQAKFARRNCEFSDPEERPLPTTVKRQKQRSDARPSDAATPEQDSGLKGKQHFRRSSQRAFSDAARRRNFHQRQSASGPRHIQRCSSSSLSSSLDKDAAPRRAVDDWLSKGMRRTAAITANAISKHKAKGEGDACLTQMFDSSSSTQTNGEEESSPFLKASSPSYLATASADQGLATRLPQYSIFIEASKISEAMSAPPSSLSARSSSVAGFTCQAGPRWNAAMSLNNPLNNDSFRYSCLESLDSVCSYTASGESEVDAAQVYAQTAQRGNRQQRRAAASEERALYLNPHWTLQRAMEKQLVQLQFQQQKQERMQRESPEEPGEYQTTAKLHSLEPAKPPRVSEGSPEEQSHVSLNETTPAPGDKEEQSSLAGEVVAFDGKLRRAFSSSNAPLAVQCLRRETAALESAMEKRNPAEKAVDLLRKTTSAGASVRRLRAADRFTDRLSWDADCAVPLEEWQRGEDWGDAAIKLNKRLTRQQLHLYGVAPFLDPLPRTSFRAASATAAVSKEDATRKQNSTSRAFFFPALHHQRRTKQHADAAEHAKQKEKKNASPNKDSPAYTPAIPPQPHAPPQPREEEAAAKDLANKHADSHEETGPDEARPEEDSNGPPAEEPPLQSSNSQNTSQNLQPKESLRRRSRLRLWRRGPR